MDFWCQFSCHKSKFVCTLLWTDVDSEWWWSEQWSSSWCPGCSGWNQQQKWPPARILNTLHSHRFRGICIKILYWLHVWTCMFIVLAWTQCDRRTALGNLFSQLLQGPHQMIALIGSGCSAANDATAEISHYYNITHVNSLRMLGVWMRMMDSLNFSDHRGSYCQAIIWLHSVSYFRYLK